jgi:hypothetical protein
MSLPFDPRDVLCVETALMRGGSGKVIGVKVTFKNGEVKLISDITPDLLKYLHDMGLRRPN